ncbi:MAG: hypothetical protein DKM50_10510 [Candidatus Margulisiibacteriota bacterium]|nr:MAG: hypothetical protein A2X43_07095 [Candidatus Margulisbacteria bacterium GWD2_39_127]OGI02954.1 MAG: hypothetical protein A2X42_12740 [Candidatus Margulisbacteria bacterium GWF2_38_17]OGI09453.1 MAG: hypothetical protein A2X41_12505 [Candidatus Margulisbacteria bacterium GWE2_39_32]PZM78747.1 MAG: hypothetical protein DKM50_10510 [Candidatus Margulisiibacteriota bacterium]HAR63351.1 hypothetical protein [Candidatus Margulisiibacteriota bacterium]
MHNENNRDHSEPRINYLKWPTTKSQGTCIFLQDFNAKPSRFSALAEYLCNNGIYGVAPDILSPDIRHDREVIRSNEIEASFEKINFLINEHKKKYKDTPIFLCGEGYGAVVALYFAQAFPSLLSGVIVLSPFFDISFNIIKKLSIIRDYFLRPQKSFCFPIKTSMVTKDQWYLDALNETGEKEYWYSAKFWGEFALMSKQVLFKKKKIKTPVFFLLADDDLLVDNKTANNFFQSLQVLDKKINSYPEFHALSVPVDRDTIYSDISEWIVSRSLIF